MESRVVIWALGWLFFTLVGGENGGVVAGSISNSSSGGGGGSSRNCKFPAIFNFGDSNSDTGASSSAFITLLPPFGMSFPNKTGRGSDGRLIIDFIAENLGLPYLDAPVDAIGTSFKHGANFATGGSKISPVVVQGSTIPFHLDVQLSQFFQFKSRAIARHNELLHNHTRNTNPPIENNLPEPEVFSKALYTIDIGQNDIAFGFDNLPISTIINHFSNSVQRLLKDGAKFLWIHGTGPLGCGPGGAIDCRNKAGCVFDEIGCGKQRNEQCLEFNKLLKDTVFKLRAQYPDAVLTYVDIYSVKYKLIANAKNYGFVDPFKFCCGNEKHPCAERDFNGNLLGTACNDPERYISWDGTHYTQAANRFVAQFVVNGSFSDPPIPIAEACHKHL